MVDIKRQELLNSLASLAKKGHLLLVGPPGCGKTWLMSRTAQRMQEENVPNVVIRADAIAVESLPDFRRALRINEPIETALNYLSGCRRSVLFIDALDAARSEAKQSVYRQLISLVLSRCQNWFVVASIRTYDARHAREFLSLFPSGTTDVPSALRLPDLRCRHLYVPTLSEAEVYEVLDQIPSLRSVYQNASLEQKELFSLPFNVCLMDQLVQTHVGPSELSSIQTAVQLFGLYWEYRITKKDDSEDRENILRRAAASMVQSNTLSVDKEHIYIEGLSDTYKGLLSDQLLTAVSKSEQRIAFGHNMLFDYAVSRLLIKETPREAFEFLAEDSSRAVFLRPSIDCFFARLWNDERDVFWKMFWCFVYEADEEYLRVLPIFTLVNEIKGLEDCQPVLDKLRNKSHLKYQFHLLAVKRTFQTLRAIRSDIIPERDRVWVDVVFHLKDYLSVEFIDEYIRVLGILIDRWDDWQDKDCQRMAIAARTIAKWAWAPPDGLDERQVRSLSEAVAILVVPLVCKTYREKDVLSFCRSII